MLKAKKLSAAIQACGWKPGQNIRNTQLFEELSEDCGVDTLGRQVIGETAKISLGFGSSDYCVRDLFEHLVFDRNGQPCGLEFMREFMDPERPSPYTLSEAASIAAVDMTAFTGITGQLLVTKILEPFQNEMFVIRKLFETIQSPLEQERWIGTSPPKDPTSADLKLAEMEAYRMSGLGEKYIQTPLTQKYGRVIGLTKEAIFFNRTGDLIRQADQLGDMLAFNEEWECIGCLSGSSTSFTEKRAGDNAPISIDLYQQASAGSGGGQLSYAYPNRDYNFVNDVPSNPLDDYHNVEVDDEYFNQMVDPDRGRPLVIGKPFIVAPHTRRINLMRVLGAESLYKISQHGLDTIGGVMTRGGNVLSQVGLTVDQVVTSRLLHHGLKSFLSLTDAQAKDIWFYGDVQRCFAYVVNWPVQVTQAPPQHAADFWQDVSLMWKASKRGVAAISEPRAVCRNNFLAEASGV